MRRSGRSPRRYRWAVGLSALALVAGCTPASTTANPPFYAPTWDATTAGPTAGGPSAGGPSADQRTTGGPAANRTSEATSPPPTASPGASGSDQRPSTPSTPRSSSDLQLVAVENFDSARLDPARWNVYDALATNGVSRWSPSLVTVAGGELRIVGTGRDPSGRGNASGGLCWCRGVGVQTYGRWQLRARFEAGVGYGQAVLLWPESERWPEDGEIDIVETPTGGKRTATATVHWGTSANHRMDSAEVTGDFTAWHTYTVDWRKGSIKVYVDERLLYDSTTSDHPPTIPDGPMSLALQQEPGPFGDNWVPAPTSSTPEKVTMRVDWVKLYR